MVQLGRTSGKSVSIVPCQFERALIIPSSLQRQKGSVQRSSEARRRPNAKTTKGRTVPFLRATSTDAPLLCACK